MFLTIELYILLVVPETAFLIELKISSNSILDYSERRMGKKFKHAMKRMRYAISPKIEKHNCADAVLLELDMEQKMTSNKF